LNWLDRLERQLGFLAIPNLILGVIVGQAVLTLAAYSNPTLPLLLYLDPAAVAAGQWYRLFTWVMVPSTSPFGMVFAILWFWMLWVQASTLEAEWGAFRCTLFLILGVVLPAAASLLFYAAFGISLIQSGFYFSTSLQLAFAALVPEYTIYLYFVLPVKMRWWAWAIGAFLLFRAATGGWLVTGEILFGIGNYLIFFLPLAIRASQQRRAVAANRRVFTEAKREAVVLQARACADCGAGTEADLRLCTCERCGEDGRFWCVQHLQPHLAQIAAPPAPAPVARPRPRAPKEKGSATRTKTKRKG
jgi:hypothetical protein